MLFSKYFKKFEDVEEAVQQFKVKGSDLLLRGESMRELYIELTAHGMMTDDGEEALYRMRGTLMDVVEEYKSRIRRNVFDKYRPERFKK